MLARELELRRKSEVNKKKVNKLCENLITSREWPRDDEEIEKLWEPIKKDLTSQDQTILLTCLVQNDNVFKWLKLISYLLPSLFSEDRDFINLIEIVVDKVKGDMAQGDFIRSLINIGEKDPENGIGLYSRLIEVASDSAISYSGLILGGAAKKRFDEAFQIVKKDLQNEKMSVKVACLKALRVAFETKTDEKFPSEILDILEDMWEIGDPSVRTEVIQGYIDFDKFDPQKCEQRLLEIATNGDSSARFTITSRLWFTNLEDQSIEVEILKICSEDNDINVLENIARVLSRKGQKFLDDSLEIVKRMLKKPVYVSLPSLDYCLRELCKNKREYCVATFEKWKDADPDLVFRLRLSRLSV